jgi:hypothetical protein
LPLRRVKSTLMPTLPSRPSRIATLSAAALLGLLPLTGCRKNAPAPATFAPEQIAVKPLASYAPNLAITGIQMSQAESLAGGKSTYIDGHVENHGSSTVTAIGVQALFANDGGAPQVLATQLSRIRTREPYIDTEPLTAAPLAPGAGADFRLIFEDVHPEWNQQTPEIHITAVTTR